MPTMARPSRRMCNPGAREPCRDPTPLTRRDHRSRAEGSCACVMLNEEPHSVRAWTRSRDGTSGASLFGRREQGVTILLSTAYLNEVERCSDRGCWRSRCCASGNPGTEEPSPRTCLPATRVRRARSGPDSHAPPSTTGRDRTGDAWNDHHLEPVVIRRLVFSRDLRSALSTH